ncbi:unnamed protein product [Cuscuta campestris]|uniref:Uncharacterized protein n=1 Tax=Cuscuta campestris TaxID=132261 RepID=A0A484KCX8_9ASTE|nr:unnamed protein product [Cuscuta campestris]
MWDNFTFVQGLKIKKALQSSIYPILFARRISATSFQGLSLTTRYDSSIDLNPSISPTSTLQEWRSSNTVAIHNALRTKEFQDPLSLFANPKDIQTTTISEVAATKNEEDIHLLD